MAASQKGKPRPPGAGRRKGTPNKVTKDVKALAQKYMASAIQELARLALKAENEATRVAALKELLDRACGKAPAAVLLSGDPESPLALIERVIVQAKD